MAIDLTLRLAETIAWCSARARAARAGVTTRSPELAAPVFQLQGVSVLDSLLSSPTVPREAVEVIAERRRAALGRERRLVLPAAGDLARGRVFATDFITDICSAATEPSNGFVDDYDIPGWDTWFAHEDSGEHGGVVYGWVPPVLLQLADAGFNVIPVNSIWWVDDRELQRVLRG